MTIREFGPPSAPYVLIEPIGDYDPDGIEGDYNKIRQRTDAEFRLITIAVDSWNCDLSPWKAPAVFGKEDFGDGAEELLKAVLSLCEDRSKTYIIGGYSLAGLFALWAATRTDVFRGVAAASPSAWFPGLTEYLREHGMPCGTVVSLSLGDREARTRNPVMSTVDTRIREIRDILQEQGADVTLTWNPALTWNPGNHFAEPDIRTAKAYAEVLQRLNGK